MGITRLMILSNPAFVMLIFPYSTVKGKNPPSAISHLQTLDTPSWEVKIDKRDKDKI